MRTMTLEQVRDEMQDFSDIGHLSPKIGTLREWLDALDAHLRREMNVPDGTCPMCNAPVLIYPDPRDGRGTVFEYAAPTSVATDGHGGEG